MTDASPPPLVHSLLILGGARSGKSSYAQKLAEESGKAPTLIATAWAGDAEMTERIAKHRSDRGDHWQLVEEQIHLVEVLRRDSAADRVIVVDCLTLWLTNLLLGSQDVDAHGTALADCIAELAGPVIFVSNEIGLGIVPDSELGRAFRDAQGKINQKLATACEAVLFMAAGLPLQLKPNLVTLRL
ncbi:MAG: bifunctional adenosylcobinamide kinase/adenosylcobinamide-phosphate guanylyltransferase [Methylovirgula sp.]